LDSLKERQIEIAKTIRRIKRLVREKRDEAVLLMSRGGKVRKQIVRLQRERRDLEDESSENEDKIHRIEAALPQYRLNRRIMNRLVDRMMKKYFRNLYGPMTMSGHWHALSITSCMWALTI